MVRSILSALEKEGARFCSVYLVDSHYANDPGKVDFLPKTSCCSQGTPLSVGSYVWKSDNFSTQPLMRKLVVALEASIMAVNGITLPRLFDELK